MHQMTKLRLVIAGALLATAAVAAPTVAAPSHETIQVSCTNGFTRTVSARAARGVTRSLNRFNAFTHSGVTCESAPGAPRVHPAKFLQIECSNGFTKRVGAGAAGGIVRALNKYNAHNHKGITCSVVP